MEYAVSIRWIHLILALFLTLQLAIGELMDVPGGEHEEARLVASAYAHEEHELEAEEEGLFEAHEALGLALVAVILLRWLLAASSAAGANWRILFPWLLREGREELLKDVKTEPAMWLKGELPAPSEHAAIAKTVHGVMLLVAAGLALTGVVLFFGWNEHGSQTELIEMVGEAHEALTGLMWALLGGHVFMALWHQKLGHRVLEKMRPFGSR